MCYIEMSVVYGLFVSWNQQEGAVMCWGHSDDSGQRPWVVLISVCGLKLFLPLPGLVRDTREQRASSGRRLGRKWGFAGLGQPWWASHVPEFTVILSLLPPLLSSSTSILSLHVSGQAAWWEDVAPAWLGESSLEVVRQGGKACRFGFKKNHKRAGGDGKGSDGLPCVPTSLCFSSHSDPQARALEIVYLLLKMGVPAPS